MFAPSLHAQLVLLLCLPDARDNSTPTMSGSQVSGAMEAGIDRPILSVGPLRSRER